MTGFVVDASVVVKWFVKEEFSEKSSVMLESGATLAAPALLFAEVSNALWSMHQRGDIGAEDLRDAVAALRAAPVVIPAPMSQLAAAATELAADLDHPVSDCFYLAVALQERYPVVTADTRFLRRVQGYSHLARQVIHVADVP